MLVLPALLSILCAEGTLSKSIDGAYTEEDGPLDLTSLIESGQAEKARSLSSVDPTLFAGVKSHAAYINVNKTNKWHTFFWFFPVENLPLESTPWIIWLQGGPGASSMYGLFDEIGPIQYANGTATKRPITWGSNYSLLFIDNPIGVGFSYSEDDAHVVKTDYEAGACLLKFIEQFVQVFPELQKAPLYIAGESYAGKFVPSFGYHIHHHKNASIPLNLKGLVLGDGWTDPPSLLHYSELGFQFGFYDFKMAADIKELEDVARKAWHDGNIDDFIQYAENVIETAFSGVRVYNILKDDKLQDNYPEFLNRSDVKAALHVGDRPFIDLSLDVFNNFHHDFYIPAKTWLEDLLEHYGVLCYNGQLDFIVGYALSEHLYHNLTWSGASEYKKAERLMIPSWNPKHTLNPIGFIKAGSNFMDVMIRGAGHMAPRDQPYAVKQLIDMFILKFT